MKTGKEKNNLCGPVKTVHTETAEIKEENGEYVEKPCHSRFVAFDSNGNMTEEIHYNPDGSTIRTTFTYDAADKLSEAADYNPDGSLAGKRVYTYDAQGRLIEEAFHKSNGTRGDARAFTYDADGNMTEEFTPDASLFEGDAGILFGVEESDSDSNFIAQGARMFKTVRNVSGKPTELFFYDADGALIQSVKYIYDVQGRLLEEVQHQGDVSPMQCAGGACPTEEPPKELSEEEAAELAALFAPGASLMKNVHTYDAEGRRIETALMYAGAVVDRRSFAFDDKGNKAEEVYYNEDGSLRSKAIYTRENDVHGNWIRETIAGQSSWDVEFGTSMPSMIHRRTISYYEDLKSEI